MTRMLAVVVVVVFVGWVAAFPLLALGEEKSGEGAKPQAADAEALWKQIEEVKPLPFDLSRRRDVAYQQQYIKEVMDRAKQRGELAKQFIEKYPDHPKKTEALFVRADSFIQAHERSPEFPQTVQAFVKAAPKDGRGAMLLHAVARMEQNEAERAKIMRQIIENYPDSDAGKMAKGALRQAEGVGKPFELSFTDAIGGKTISMADLKGKVVVVDFWATWCGPCVAEMPKMKQLYAEYKDKGVEFIGVSLDAPEDQGGLKKLKDFVAEKQITWPQYYQGNAWQSEFSRSWGITSIPAVFVIDAEGKLHSTKARGQLATLIPELLKKAGKEISLR